MPLNLSVIFKSVLPKENEYYVQADNLGENAAPILITQSEFMRRYREMSAMGGGMNFYGEMPAMYNITVNMQNPLVARIMSAKAEEVAPAQVIPDAASDASEEVKRTVTEAKESAAAAHKADLEAFAGDNEILKQITDLALLANGMLKGIINQNNLKLVEVPDGYFPSKDYPFFSEGKLVVYDTSRKYGYMQTPDGNCSCPWYC